MDADFGYFNVDYDVPSEISYNIDALKMFIEKDPEAVIIFYGGEPMLCVPQMKQIMHSVKAKQFNIQTNGLHLNKLEPEYVNKLTTIFVSIDGTEELTDYYRGKSVYKRVTQNLNKIKENGFEGEIVARMTLMEQTNIYTNIKWLLDNPDHSFTSVHWQLDAGFWKTDFQKRKGELSDVVLC
jgi:sulfatase maturation enzyme AslB (radical SAM superfamily)